MIKLAVGKFNGNSIINDTETIPALSWRRDQVALLGKTGFFQLEEVELTQARIVWVIKDFIETDKDVDVLSLLSGSE